MLKFILPIVGVGLAACVPAEPLPAFNSEQEKRCYMSASDQLTDPNTTLRRSQNGRFIEVQMDQGFIRSTKRSDNFDRCMSGVANAPDRLTNSTPVKFTANETVIWNSLTDDARARALLFIQNGGTLAAFVAQG